MKTILIIAWILMLFVPQNIQNYSIETMFIKLKLLKERSWSIKKNKPISNE